MKAPDKIYIYEHAGGNSYSTSPTDNLADKKHEIEYIRKEALLKWAKKKNKKFNKSGNKNNDDFQRGMAAGIGFLISTLINKF